MATTAQPTPSVPAAARPPGYAQDAADVQESYPPDTLRFAGRFVHSANSTDADSPGLYEINHQIDFLRETDGKVEFNRIDYALKRRGNNDAAAAAAAAVPEILAHPKHVCNLERTPAVVHDAFPYYIWPASRSALGSVGVRFGKAGRHGAQCCRAWRVRRKPGTNAEYEPKELLFSVRPNNDVLDWLDGADARIAVEEAKDDLYSLNILVPMEKQMRDALVATWCIRLWETRAVQFHKKRTWKDRKYIMQTCTRDLPGKGGW